MKRVLLFAVVVIALVTVVACGAPASAPAAESPMTAAPATDAMSVASGGIALQSVAEPGAAESTVANAAAPQVVSSQDIASNSNLADLGNRKIIRNGYLRIEARQVITALNEATRLSTQVGGYVVSSRSWTGTDNLPYAALSFAVPVERFEHALEQTRLLGSVKDENVSSQDVTGQFFDLESRITNLEATAERIRGFLQDAKKVDEALAVNRELSNIEEQLEVLKGQRNALAQQTAFSIINIDFIPVPPVVTTGEVLETVQTWSPLVTFNAALDVLLNLARVGVDLLIWLVTLGIPALLVLLLLWAIARRLLRLRRAVSLS
ncbi:MAG: DUF4349 domain-containing protein [Caldilineaceae bacterium]